MENKKNNCQLSYDTLIESQVKLTSVLPKTAPLELSEAEARSESTNIKWWVLSRIADDLGEMNVDAASDEAESAIKSARQVIDRAISSIFHWRVFGQLKPVAGMSAEEIEESLRIMYVERPSDLLKAVREGTQFNIDIDGLSRILTGYMASSFRSRFIDELFVRLFVDHVVANNLGRIIHNPHRLVRFPYWMQEEFSLLFDGRENFRSDLAWAVAGSALIALAYFGLNQSHYSNGVAGAGFIFLGAGCYLYFVCREQDKITRFVKNGLIDIYQYLHGKRQVHVNQLRVKMQDLSNKGVSWPAALWALLDDLDRRRYSVLGERPLAEITQEY
ncbi:MAG: hypothetical protein H3C51_08480 [Rubellimicrobium sp.]|nr:hypothetical protein [Rubellimicrobium sp.]